MVFYVFTASVCHNRLIENVQSASVTRAEVLRLRFGGRTAAAIYESLWEASCRHRPLTVIWSAIPLWLKSLFHLIKDEKEFINKIFWVLW